MKPTHVSSHGNKNLVKTTTIVIVLVTVIIGGGLTAPMIKLLKIRLVSVDRANTTSPTMGTAVWQTLDSG